MSALITVVKKRYKKKPKANSGRHRNLARDPHNFINDFDYPRHSITKEAYIASLYYYFSSFTKEFFIVNRRFTKMTFFLPISGTSNYEERQ